MILYLSGTGNTKWAAKSLANALGEQIIDIAKINASNFEFAEKGNGIIGICFPVHGWRPPNLLVDFVKKMRIAKQSFRNTYIFLLCTEGDNTGRAMPYLEHLLSLRGITVNAYYDVRMPNTYVGLPFMDVDSKDVEEMKLKKAQERISEIYNKIKERTETYNIVFEGKWPKTDTLLLGAVFNNLLVTDKFFNVNEKECARCGKCAAVCPVENIKWNKGQIPIWKHNKKCMTCFACYHNCSKHAIQYGLATHGKGQYHFHED